MLGYISRAMKILLGKQLSENKIERAKSDVSLQDGLHVLPKGVIESLTRYGTTATGDLFVEEEIQFSKITRGTPPKREDSYQFYPSYREIRYFTPDGKLKTLIWTNYKRGTSLVLMEKTIEYNPPGRFIGKRKRS